MRSRRKEREIEPTDAELRLRELIEREAEERGVELQRTLALARAESVSLLAQEERRLAEERRKEFAERERHTASELSLRLIDVQKRVEERLSAWAADLERAQARIPEEIAKLAQRQEQAIAEVEARITA